MTPKMTPEDKKRQREATSIVAVGILSGMAMTGLSISIGANFNVIKDRITDKSHTAENPHQHHEDVAKKNGIRFE